MKKKQPNRKIGKTHEPKRKIIAYRLVGCCSISLVIRKTQLKPHEISTHQFGNMKNCQHHPGEPSRKDCHPPASGSENRCNKSGKQWGHHPLRMSMIQTLILLGKPASDHQKMYNMYRAASDGKNHRLYGNSGRDTTVVCL